MLPVRTTKTNQQKTKDKQKNKIPLHWRNSLLVIFFTVSPSFTTVSSIFQIPGNIFTALNLLSSMPTVLEKGKKEREETIYWPHNQVPCGCPADIISQPSVG